MLNRKMKTKVVFNVHIPLVFLLINFDIYLLHVSARAGNPHAESTKGYSHALSKELTSQFSNIWIKILCAACQALRKVC
jgi:hypothetical protein